MLVNVEWTHKFEGHLLGPAVTVVMIIIVRELSTLVDLKAGTETKPINMNVVFIMKIK